MITNCRKARVYTLIGKLFAATLLSIATAHVQAQNDAIPEISANGMAGTANLTTADSLVIEIELEANQTNGINAGWWMVADTGELYYSYSVATDIWSEGLSVGQQGPLSDLPVSEILDLPAPLPTGSFTFYFAVGLLANGEVDMNDLVYSAVTVNITDSGLPPPSGFSMISPYTNVNDLRSVFSYFAEPHRGLDFATNEELKPFRAAAAGTVQTVELIFGETTGKWNWK